LLSCGSGNGGADHWSEGLKNTFGVSFGESNFLSYSPSRLPDAVYAAEGGTGVTELPGFQSSL
jgi:hypothetical protein